jgi:hypothetical protein
MRRSVRTLVTVAVVGMAALLPAGLAEPADEVVLDQWFAQFHREAKTGWAHVRRVRSVVEGAEVLVTEAESESIRGPGGEKLETPMRFSSRIVEDVEGAVLSWSTSAETPFGKQTREGSVTDGTISSVADGKRHRAPYPEGALGPAAVERAIAATLRPGGEGRILEFSPLDPGKGEAVTWKVHSTTEPVDILGRHVWLYRVEKTDSTGIPEVLLLEGKGRRYGGALNLGLIRYYETEEAVAKADRDPVSWLTSRIVAPDRVIPAPEAGGRLVLRLSRREGAVGNLPESRSQRIVARGEDGSVDLELTDGKPDGELVVWIRPYPGGDDPCLAETPILPITYERVKRFAAAAVGGTKDGLGCARRIDAAVRRFVRPAPANVGFASADLVLSSATGDSTESAVLAAAAARSVGLPSRLVAGFVYWGPGDWPGDRFPRGAFAFHVWAEIHAGEDLWVPVDSMRPPGKTPWPCGSDATHVAVLRSDAATPEPFTDIAMPVLEFMDGLEIRVLDPK